MSSDDKKKYFEAMELFFKDCNSEIPTTISDYYLLKEIDYIECSINRDYLNSLIDMTELNIFNVDKKKLSDKLPNVILLYGVHMNTNDETTSANQYKLYTDDSFISCVILALRQQFPDALILIINQDKYTLFNSDIIHNAYKMPIITSKTCNDGNNTETYVINNIRYSAYNGCAERCFMEQQYCIIINDKDNIYKNNDLTINIDGVPYLDIFSLFKYLLDNNKTVLQLGGNRFQFTTQLVNYYLKMKNLNNVSYPYCSMKDRPISKEIQVYYNTDDNPNEILTKTYTVNTPNMTDEFTQWLSEIPNVKIWFSGNQSYTGHPLNIAELSALIWYHKSNYIG